MARKVALRALTLPQGINYHQKRESGSPQVRGSRQPRRRTTRHRSPILRLRLPNHLTLTPPHTPTPGTSRGQNQAKDGSPGALCMTQALFLSTLRTQPRHVTYHKNRGQENDSQTDPYT